METFDAVVIGAGSGGLTAAVGLRNIGKSVLLIEREHIGGECTNSGCIPSKALLHHAKSYATAVAIADSNGHTKEYRRHAFSYVRNIIGDFLRDETPAAFEKKGITVVIGEAVFTGTRTITANDTQYQFTTAVMATGSSPRLIEVPGLDDQDILTNQNLFTITEAPKRTLIIGGGPIGMEMGQALALLGSKVTIVDTGAAVGKLEDPAVATVIQNKFAELDITFIGNAQLQSVSNKTATISMGGDGETAQVPFDKILVAIGRTPNIPDGLDTAGIMHTDYGVTVNHNYQTSNRRVYALGDCADRFKFTHHADDVARQVVTRIATKGIVPVTQKAIPKVTYTDPELAQVGLSEAEAIVQYGLNNIHRIEVPFSANDRARTDNNVAGVLVLIVRRLSGKILGVHIAGPNAGELLAVFSVALQQNISLWKLRRVMFAYPTYSLLIKKAGDYFFAAQIKTARTDITSMFGRMAPTLLLLILWGSVIGTIAVYRHNNELSLTELGLQLFTFITETPWGPLLYVAAYTIRPITFIPGTILTILSGVFFGLPLGVLYTVIGANLSAGLAYMIGRFFSHPTNNASTSIFGRFATLCRTKPFVTILTMRLLFLPYDGVNYGAGFLRVPFLAYIVATIIGTLLGIATFVSLGASLSITEFSTNGFTTNALDISFITLSVAIFVVSLITARVLQRRSTQ